MSRHQKLRDSLALRSQVNRQQCADQLRSGFNHRMQYREIIDGTRGMNGVVQAALGGAILGAGVAFGY
jgi:hypothetical protein